MPGVDTTSSIEQTPESELIKKLPIKAIKIHSKSLSTNSFNRSSRANWIKMWLSLFAAVIGAKRRHLRFVPSMLPVWNASPLSVCLRAVSVMLFQVKFSFPFPFIILVHFLNILFHAGHYILNLFSGSNKNKFNFPKNLN